MKIAMGDWGVFAVDRGIWEHAFLNADKEPFTKREAWMWLVCAAAWKPKKMSFCGRVIALQRGEFLFSIRFLANRWGWTKAKVEYFFKSLKMQDMVQDRIQDSIKIYLVSNFNRYQTVGLPKQDTSEDIIADAHRTGCGREQDKEESVKPLNRKNQEESIKGPRAKSARSSKTKLPDGIPSQEGFENAQAYWQQHGREDLYAASLDQAQAFRDYHIAQGSTSADWECSWRTWYRNALKFNRKEEMTNEQRRAAFDAAGDEFERRARASLSYRNGAAENSFRAEELDGPRLVVDHGKLLGAVRKS